MLREELLNFRRKINLATAYDSYEHWREPGHDDLVLATALVCWAARRTKDVLELITDGGGPSPSSPPWSSPQVTSSSMINAATVGVHIRTGP